MNLAERHAPRVILHASEEFAPMKADQFISQSCLVWRQSDTEWEAVVGPGEVDPDRLGIHSLDPYTYVEMGETFSTKDLTRPFEAEGAAGLALEKGFALVNQQASPGLITTPSELEQAVGTTPMYCEMRRDGKCTLISYWLFFGSSSLPTHWKRARMGRIRGWFVDFKDLARLLRRGQAHQGDWEGLTLEISEHGEIARMYVRAHHDGEVVVPPSADPRPTVYCALGSHACFVSPNSPNPEGDEIPVTGVTWDPLASTGQLVDATTQPWYGFGGGWGDPDLDQGINVDFRRRDLAGPLGPGPHKRIWRKEDVVVAGGAALRGDEPNTADDV